MPVVQIQQLEIADGHRGDQRDGHVARGRFGAQQIRARRLGGPAQLAPQIDLERRHAAEGKTVVGHAATQRVLARRRPARARLDVEEGELVGAHHAQDRRRLFDARQGDAEVAVVGQRLLDQRLEGGIGEQPPPGQVGEGVIDRCRLAVAGWHVEGGPLVIRPDHAASEQQAARQQGDVHGARRAAAHGSASSPTVPAAGAGCLRRVR